MDWKLINDNTASQIWDKTLADFSDCNVYQSYNWGEYRRKNSGVRPCRWMATNDSDEPVALFQGFYLGKFLGVGIITGEGGPLGDYN
ncbi:MAG: hypothetical protein DWQ10_10085, partial [Calditrichaeota bacterium]